MVMSSTAVCSVLQEYCGVLWIVGVLWIPSVLWRIPSVFLNVFCTMGETFCSTEDIQYRGGKPSVLWRMFSIAEGYHQCSRGIPLAILVLPPQY